jgi:hypothetical protein
MCKTEKVNQMVNAICITKHNQFYNIQLSSVLVQLYWILTYYQFSLCTLSKATFLVFKISHSADAEIK